MASNFSTVRGVMKCNFREYLHPLAISFLLLSCVPLLHSGCKNSNKTMDAGTLPVDVQINKDTIFDVLDSGNTPTDAAVDLIIPDMPTGPVISAWIRNCGNDNTRVGATDLAVDLSGNIYVSGDYMGTLQCGKINLISKGFLDGFIIKLNPLGEPQWGLSLGSLAWDKISAVSIDSNGNVYIAGNYEGKATFGGMTISAGSAVSRQSFIAKLDASGKVLRISNISSTGSCGITALVSDSLGNLYVAGTFSGQIGINPTVLYSQTRKFLIGQITQTGTWKFALTATVSKDSLINDLAVDMAGNLYIAGNYSGTAKFGGHTLFSNGGWDGYLVKITNNKTYAWALEVSGLGAWDRIASVVVDSSSEVVIGGQFSGSTINVGNKVLSSSGGSDGLIAKIDDTGKVKWALAAGGIGNEYYNAFIDSAGAVWATGNLESSGYIGSKYLKGFGATIAKIGQSGITKWAGSASGPGYSILEKSFYSSSGYVIAVGTLKGGEMNFLGGKATAQSVKLWDLLIVKLKLY